MTNNIQVFEEGHAESFKRALRRGDPVVIYRGEERICFDGVEDWPKILDESDTQLIGCNACCNLSKYRVQDVKEKLLVDNNVGLSAEELAKSATKNNLQMQLIGMLCEAFNYDYLEVDLLEQILTTLGSRNPAKAISALDEALREGRLQALNNLSYTLGQQDKIRFSFHHFSNVKGAYLLNPNREQAVGHAKGRIRLPSMSGVTGMAKALEEASGLRIRDDVGGFEIDFPIQMEINRIGEHSSGRHGSVYTKNHVHEDGKETGYSLHPDEEKTQALCESLRPKIQSALEAATVIEERAYGILIKNSVEDKNS